MKVSNDIFLIEGDHSIFKVLKLFPTSKSVSLQKLEIG